MIPSQDYFDHLQARGEMCAPIALALVWIREATYEARALTGMLATNVED